MLKDERLKRMDSYIIKEGFVSMKELCDVFDMSMSTVRNDVQKIIKEGHAKKVYGGVAYVQPEVSVNAVSSLPVSYGTYDSRLKTNWEEKKAIGRQAAGTINDGDIVFLDVGTTCTAVLDYIPGNRKVTIICSDLCTINKAIQRPNITICAMGGVYHNKSNSFRSRVDDMKSFLLSYNITRAFLGVTGISKSGKLTTSEDFSRELRELLVSTCSNTSILADSSKFGKVALQTYAELSDVSMCISDDGLSENFIKLCESSGTKLILAKTNKKQETKNE